MFSDSIQSLAVNLGYRSLGGKRLPNPLRETMISFTCPVPLCYIFENMFISFCFSTAEMLFLLIREEIVLPKIQITYFLPRIQLSLLKLNFFWKMEVYLPDTIWKWHANSFIFLKPAEMKLCLALKAFQRKMESKLLLGQKKKSEFFWIFVVLCWHISFSGLTTSVVPVLLPRPVRKKSTFLFSPTEVLHLFFFFGFWKFKFGFYLKMEMLLSRLYVDKDISISARSVVSVFPVL